jgi:hypothetical protein
MLKPVLAKVVLTALALLTPCLAQKGSVEGRVTNQAGEPLKTTRVRLILTRAGSTAAESLSDADGNFVLQNVAPGSCALVAEHSGYLQSHPDLTLEPGQRLTGFAVKMTPAALVAGRVVDENGDPVPTARVAILAEDEEGYPTSSTKARADGSFVIGDLAAGRYDLRAEDEPRQSGNVREVSGRKEAFVPTYYSSAIQLSKATLVPVETGAEVRDLEIRFQKARVFHIRGMAVDASGGAPMGGASLLMKRDDPAASVTSALTRPDGAFEFSNVLPGKYAMLLNRPPGRRATNGDVVGRLIVTVGNEDLDGVVFRAGPGLEISGRVTMEGGGPVEGAGLQLDFAEADFNGHSTEQPSQKDGTFVLRRLEPAKYRVRMYGLPAGSGVKSIHWGDQDVTDADLDLTKNTEGKTLNIVLAPRPVLVTQPSRESGASPQ